MSGMSYSLNLGLGDAPDSNLPPDVWEELNKLSLACKHIANALGLGSTGSSNPHLAGTPGVDVTIQNYAKVRRTVSIDIPAGSVVEFGDTATYLTSGSYPYPIAFSESHISAGGTGEFIMLGMVYYAPGGLVPGAKYYVNYSVAGGISSSGTGRYVGQAFAADILYFDPVRN